MNLTIAGRALTGSEATAMLGVYAHNHYATLDRYDGRAQEQPARWRTFTTDDIKAAKVIEVRAIRSEVADGILACDLPWDDVPERSVDLADVGPTAYAYEQLARFYVALRQVHGVGPAVATKMMYLRWPAATPIEDSLLRDLYEEQAAAKYQALRAGDELPSVVRELRWRRLYSFAVRDDLIANRASGALDLLRSNLETMLPADDVARTRTLSDCRLLDILAWSLQKYG